MTSMYLSVDVIDPECRSNYSRPRPSNKSGRRKNQSYSRFTIRTKKSPSYRIESNHETILGIDSELAIHLL